VFNTQKCLQFISILQTYTASVVFLKMLSLNLLVQNTPVYGITFFVKCLLLHRERYLHFYMDSLFLFSLALQHSAGYGLLVLEVS
jgi:hypothetical protein